MYIHYGHENFDKTKFEPIKNKEEWIKPDGGLWACRENSDNSWKEWCEDLEWEDKLKKHFTFTLKENANVLIIASSSQLETLPKAKSGAYTMLDFEELAKQYDAIEILISKDIKLHFKLYGWDCDSILIMNPEVIEELNK